MSSRTAERGVTLVAAIVMTVALVSVTGLAIDASVLYAVKARLSAAVDAAALAGARSLNRGMNLASQRASAQQTALAFLNANFPNGNWGSSNRTTNVTVDETVYRTRTVNVTAGVDAPLYFLRILGLTASRVTATSQASRRDVNMVLVLDRSGSLKKASADDDVRACAKAFADLFAEGRDRVGMVSFSGYTRVDFVPSFQFKTGGLLTKIDELDSAGNTATAQGLWAGYDQLRNINEAGALNIILLFTDGRPTAIAGSFRVRNDSTCANKDPRDAYVAMSPSSTKTFGAFKPAGGSEWALADRSRNCAYGGDNWTSESFPPNADNVTQDLAYIPDVDLGGNSTTGYQAVERYTNGTYANRLRIDRPGTVRNAAYNAADNGAAAIRANTALGTIVFAIGLGLEDTGPAETVDHDFLRRLSNDPASPIYDSSKPTGRYAYAPTAAQLNDAFSRIASEILRLAL